MPLSHAMHEAAPPFEYVPPTHAEQLREPVAEEVPPVQLSQLEAWAPEYLPESHAVHNDEEVPLKLPDVQIEQLAANPAEYVPPLHDEHVVAPEATPVWKPAVHSKHSSTRAWGAYVPTGHASHERALYTYVPAGQSEEAGRRGRSEVKMACRGRMCLSSRLGSKLI